MNKLAVIFIGVFFMGCAGMSTQISVSNDNVLTCTMPSLKVKVADNFTYKPERSGKDRLSGKTTRHDHTNKTLHKHFFWKVVPGQKKVTAAVGIKIMKSSAKWDYHNSFRKWRCAYKGERRINGQRYHYCIFIGGKNLKEDEYVFNYDIGFTLYKITGSNNEILIIVDYSKDIENVDFSVQSPRAFRKKIDSEVEHFFSNNFEDFKILN